MMDWYTSDKGSTFKYANSLTYRQVMTWWERFWARREFDARVQIALDPWLMSDKKGKGHTSHDLTTDEGIASAMGIEGLKIKVIKKTPDPEK